MYNTALMELRERISEELLPQVQRPGQYIGGEWNQLVRPGDWKQAALRVAVGFPDTYAIGMSHLGGQILYWLCNHTPGVCAERVYAPWLDAEQVMRERRIELFTWDTRQPVREADILALSLQYEMTYTNLLLMLDLAGIPLRREERDDSHPLVLIGGPQADNPEPVADFVDLVVIGDGEHSMAAIIEECRRMKREGAGRSDMIVELARRFEWLYAPGLYDFDYHADGTIKALRPSAACPEGFLPHIPIIRCETPDFEDVAVPLRPIVAHVPIVHDRIGIEVMRGCPRRCRFCHAGYTKKPIRWRSVEKVIDIAEQSWQATGHEEIGLLSLSTADYPHLKELAERLNERFHPRHVNLSIPSLRVDKMLSEIPGLVSGVRKSGLTIAVEAADEAMRAALRKKVMDVDLLEGVKQAYAAGWNTVKLYFICGLPGETEADIQGVFELARQVSLARRELGRAPAAVTASVSWLVPKAHTPLQWAGQKTLGEFFEAGDLLKKIARQQRSAVKLHLHDPRRSVLEAVFARGDRRLSRAIEAAYQLGARMDGWDECFHYDLWLRAFEQTGIDPAFYAQRTRSQQEILPWEHIHSGPEKTILWREYQDFLARLGERANKAEVK